MISDRIFDDIPPQMKISNMVIPILMRFWSLVSKLMELCEQRQSEYVLKMLSSFELTLSEP